MNRSLGKKNDEKQLTAISNSGSSVNIHCKREFKTQMISQMVLNDILQKAEQIKNHNSQLQRFIQSQKLKQSKEFTSNKSTQVLQNFLLKPQLFSPKMENDNYLPSPSKSPYSFLKFEQSTIETDRLDVGQQTWPDKRKLTKIYNCNKIYILNKKHVNADTIDQKFSIKSIKVNDNLPRVFERASHRPQIKKLSINNSNIVPGLTRQGRFTVNQLGSTTQKGRKNNLLQVSKNTIVHSSFHDQNINQQEQDKIKLIKLENNQKPKDAQKSNLNDRQTNQHIAFLRQRKQKLEKIMKVFDIDDQQKKKHKIQRQNLLKQAKTQNVAQNFSKMPSMTTDYLGNPIYFQDPFIKTQKNMQKNSKKSYPKLPKYETHEQAVLPHNVNFKIKDIDEKTKNFFNQIFSSICSPLKTSNKKIAFNMKNLQVDKKIEKQKDNTMLKNISSNVSFNYDDERQDFQKFQYQDLETEPYQLNNKKVIKNNYDHSKDIKSALKYPYKKILSDSQNSTNDKNKENTPFGKLFGNLKNQNFVLNLQKTKTEQSSQSKIINKSSLKQLEAIHRQEYVLHKQRIYPKLSEQKKTKISNKQNDYKKIVETSNQNTDKNLIESKEKPQKNIFQEFIQKYKR